MSERDSVCLGEEVQYCARESDKVEKGREESTALLLPYEEESGSRWSGAKSRTGGRRKNEAASVALVDAC